MSNDFDDFMGRTDTTNVKTGRMSGSEPNVMQVPKTKFGEAVDPEFVDRMRAGIDERAFKAEYEGTFIGTQEPAKLVPLVPTETMKAAIAQVRKNNGLAETPVSEARIMSGWDRSPDQVEPINARPSVCPKTAEIEHRLVVDSVQDTTTAAIPNYGTDAPASKIDITSVFGPLTTLVKEVQKYDKRITELENELKFLEERRRKIMDGDLPRMMIDAGVPSFETDELKISYKKDFRNSVPADRREEALDWLEQNKHADIIKRQVAVQFAVNQTEQARKLAADLAKEYGDGVSVQRNAAPATIKSILRKRLESGSTIPMDLFGVVEYTTAVFKLK